MATIDSNVLPTVIRQSFFSATISISGTNVTNVTCIPEYPDSGITISTSLGSIVISGRNLAASFNDRATYVEKGSSDLSETPKTVVGPIWGSSSVLPENKDLFIFNQDTAPNKSKEYYITVVELDGETSITSNFTVTQTIQNDWSSGTAALKAYFGT